MDFARGSRRARHVATTAAGGSQRALGQTPRETQQQQQQQQLDQEYEHDQEQQPPHLHPQRQRHQHQHRQQVTPDAHRTPDNPFGGGGGPAAPPPNPFRLHRSTHMNASHRLSMPFESDGSDAEPDLSVLGMARPGGDLAHHASSRMYDDEDDGDETVSQDAYDAEDTSAEENLEVDEDDEEEGDDDDIEDDEDIEDEPMPLVDPASIGLKEISNLGKFTVSSHKQGNGVEELRSDDLKLYWQSDGPQPHRLTVYFVKRVGIRDIRFYVDYSEDESYTPTKIVFKSGTSENKLIEFASLSLENPQGWQQVPIAGAGGEPDGNTLVSYVLQMQILENHQNGKDTHLRGIKIYAFDPDSAQGGGVTERSDLEDIVEMTGSAASQKVEEGTGDKLGDIARAMAVARLEGGDAGFAVPDFMREPEIR